MITCEWLHHWRFFVCVFTTSFLSVFPAYYFAIVNVAEGVFKTFIYTSFNSSYGIDLTTRQLTIVWAFTVTSYNFGTVLGSLFTSFFAEKFGRRISLMCINNIAVIVAAGLMGFAQLAKSYAMLVAGRFLAGACTGLAYGLLAIYLTELSPVKYRGFSASTQNLMISFNTLLTLFLALPQILGTWELWIPLQGLAAPFALLQILLTPLFPETPIYLLLKKDDYEAAKQAFLYVSPKAPEDTIKDSFNHYRKEAEIAGHEMSLKTALTTPYIRKPIFIGVVCNVAVITTGIVVIFSYSTELFQEIGMSQAAAQYSSIVMSGFNTMGSVCGIFLMDRVGRRPLMLTGLMITSGCNLVFMIFSIIQQHISHVWPAYISIVAIVVHVTVFNIGPGAISFFISSEMTPQSARSLGAMISITVGGFSQVVTNFAFRPVQDAIGPYVFLTLVIPALVFFLYLYFTLPETKNRPVDEIVKRWMYESLTGDQVVLRETAN